MQSEISSRLKLRYSPVAIVFTDEKPAGALEFLEGRRGCTKEDHDESYRF